MELKTRMDSLKINVKTLHIKTFCERCFKVLSDVKGSVVLRPYPLTCDERNGHSYDWDCYESWLLDNINRWLMTSSIVIKTSKSSKQMMHRRMKKLKRK